MNERLITDQQLQLFKTYLVHEEKSGKTIEKYMRDVKHFCERMAYVEITKERVLKYKNELIESGYAAASINSMISSINHFLVFLGWEDCKVKGLRLQRQIYCPENKELTKEEYFRLLDAAKDQPQMSMVMQTICGTGIRISELKFFTVEDVRAGQINVQCKNKIRVVFVVGKLRKKLLDYAKKCGIKCGPIFITRNGRHLNRSNIWAKMKRLCKKVKVEASKVFPHNLRKLFARTFYRKEKDIAKLADILGHSSIETTRIYIMTTGIEHQRQIERLGLVV